MKKFHLKIKPKVMPSFCGSSFGHLFSKIFYVIAALFIFQGSYNLSAQSPLAANGKLSVSGTQLVNKNGTAIQLRGMSTHGTQWYTEDYNFNSLSVLVNKWGIDVFRIAMYPSDKPDATKNSYEGNPTFWKGYVDNLVDICGTLGVYSIIDWHVLTPGDPNDPTYLPMAKEFWDYMSKKHAGKNQVMYEICNEPNGVTWATVKAYANIIIPIIRANDPNSIIIVGSPTWSSDVDIAATDPIKDPVDATKLATNVMYTFHFYAASHSQSYRDKITAAMGKGLAIFVTEWGSTDASGGGTSNWTETQTWMDFLATNKISCANWSYSDKSETSAVLQPGSGALLLWDNTNAQGDKIKTLLATPSDSWTSTGNWSPAVTIATPLNGDYFLPGTAVTLTSTPVDKDGTIASVDFLVDGVKVGTATAAPFSYIWTPATVKDYVITAVAKDNAGATGTSTPFTYHVVASITETAYPSGTAWPVPGDIACMNYDNGGEMIAYHDLDGVHKGTTGSARPNDGVDVEGTADIGYVLTGEWLKYTVNVASAGTYDFTLQCASGLPGTGQFHLESNGVPITAITNVPSSGSWGSYQPIVVKSVPLNAGVQIIKLYIDCGNFNFSTMNFKLTGTIIYSITASAGTGGTISPTGKVTLAAGANQTFTITPTLGNKVTDVTVDGTSVGAVTTYTFANLAANHTIVATFGPAVAYTITATAATGGTITPSGATTVYEGSSQTFSVVPSAGYKINDIKVDGVSIGTVSPYTFSKIAANHTIAATFTALANFTISASAGSGGTITPSGLLTLLEGATQAYAIQATPGFKILDVKVDGVSQGKITSYTFTNIAASHTIAVTFDTTSCDLLSLFGAPTTSPLASVNATYSYVYVLGTHAAITNISKLTVNWDLANNGFNQFAINTTNGVPSWYMDLRSSMTYKLNAASPFMTITGTGSGLDGDYYVALDKGNLVLIDKLANYAIYFSNTATAPQTCSQTTNYTITASAGTGGTITPSGAVTVAQGANSTFSIVPATGYKIVDVTVDGVSKGAVSTYTFTAVTANHTIAATFTVPTYTITASAGSNGTISPIGTIVVAQGASQSFTITPAQGYVIDKIFIDGGEVVNPIITNITANHTISVTFKLATTFTITASAGTGGTITPAGAVSVNSGANQTFAIAPSTGYKISDVTVDGVSVGAVATYTFTSVAANHTIAATFVVIPTFTITASAGANGTLSPTGTIIILPGGNQTIIITPAPGYMIDNVTVDGVSVGALSTYTFSNVTANHTITATFKLIPTFTITSSAGVGGTISPSGSVQVTQGTNQTYTISTLPGYVVSTLTVDGAAVRADGSYTFISVVANHTIVATFAPIPTFTISASAGSNGTISPTGSISLLAGASQTYTIAPLAGYAISDVIVDGTSVGAVATYTFTAVGANHTIAASFTVQSCNLLTQFAVPRATALPTLANSSYSHAYVLGTGGPTLSNVSNFTINWDLPNRGLWQFSINTNNGVPAWWLSLLTKITQTFASASPACTITGSGVTGLDGDYWVTVDGANFVMVSKTGNFAIYASSSATPPTACAKSALAANAEEMQVTVFPNPVETGTSISLTLSNVSENGTTIVITDMDGRTIQKMIVRENLVTIPIDGKFTGGMYIISVIDQSNVYNTRFIVK